VAEYRRVFDHAGFFFARGGAGQLQLNQEKPDSLVTTAALLKLSEREGTMHWYWWLLIVWVVTGLLALVMEFRDNAAMRENVGWAEVWPVLLGPLWLLSKLHDWLLVLQKR
jgi:hypothetical protein